MKFDRESPQGAFLIFLAIIFFGGMIIAFSSGGKFSEKFGFILLLAGIVVAIAIFALIIIFISNRIKILSVVGVIKTEFIKLKFHETAHEKALPFSYGVGVVSALMDFNIEFKKDVVAGVMDLVAKGQLRLINLDLSGNYEFRARENFAKNIDWNLESKLLNMNFPTSSMKSYTNENFNSQAPVESSRLASKNSTLLSNEEYLLNQILTSEKIKYKTWRQLCLDDAVSLGLLKKRAKNWWAIGAWTVIFSTMTWYFYNSFTDTLGESVMLALVIFVPIFWLMFWALDSFVAEKILRRTTLGDEHVRRWLRFYNFLRDSGNFKYDTVEQVVIWQSYLSHAQIFGLAKNISRNGYNELTRGKNKIIDTNFRDFSKYVSGLIRR